MTLSVFLDWFGVLADNELMTRRWRLVEAHLLKDRYGGRLSTWTKVHDRAFRWYLDQWSTYGPEGVGSYRKVWKHLEIEWMRRTLTSAGVRPPRSRVELFRLDRELIYEVTRRISPAYPHTRQVLKSLRRRGYRLFLVSNANTTFIKGALEATGLANIFDEAFSPDRLDAFKGSMRYWRKILRLSESDPKSSVVVDDRAKFLRVPARLGVRAILVDPTAESDAHFISVKNVRELLSHSVLPKS